MEPTSAGLIRGLRRWDLVALAINGIVGAGIFGLPAAVYANVGTWSLAAFVVCALVVTLIILCFAEVSSRFTETGGPYLYAREAFGGVVGFEVGWLMWLARLTAFAANSNLLVGYIGYFWPAAGAGVARACIITIVVAAFTGLNIAGIRKVAVTTNFFTVAKLLPLLGFVAIGLFFVDPSRYSFSTPPAYGAFTSSVLVLVYAFSGFEMITIAAGEAIEPRRNVPLALLTAIGFVVALYVLIQFVCIGTLPGLGSSARPLADASRTFLGRAGAAIIAAGAVVSILPNLNVTLLAGSRLTFAMAERHELPRFLSRTHRAFHTPHFSIVLTATVVLAMALSSTFIYAVTISSIARLLTYSTTCAAVPVLRINPRSTDARFRLKFGVPVSILCLMLIAWLLSNATWREARDTGIAAVLGLLIYFACHVTTRRALARDADAQPVASHRS